MHVFFFELSTNNIQNLFGIASKSDSKVCERLLIGKEVVDFVAISTN